MASSVRVGRMITAAPKMYETSKTHASIQNTSGTEWDTIEARNDDVLRQAFPPTATWGLRYWEELYAIPTVEDDGYEIRRSRIQAKRRGQGKFSARLIESVAEAFTNGDVSVEFDIPTYVVRITFTNTTGIPHGMEDLKAILRDVVHAHLGLQYIVNATWWDNIDAGNVTWDVADTYRWDDFERVIF